MASEQESPGENDHLPGTSVREDVDRIQRLEMEREEDLADSPSPISPIVFSQRDSDDTRASTPPPQPTLPPPVEAEEPHTSSNDSEIHRGGGELPVRPSGGEEESGEMARRRRESEESPSRTRKPHSNERALDFSDPLAVAAAAADGKWDERTTRSEEEGEGEGVRREGGAVVLLEFFEKAGKRGGNGFGRRRVIEFGLDPNARGGGQTKENQHTRSVIFCFFSLFVG